MGCDIHAGAEYKKDGKWTAFIQRNPYFDKGWSDKEFTADLNIDRNYDAFAILGNVRNEEGYNFLSEDRDIPEDTSDEIRNNVLSNEHSATHVYLNEILSFDWTQTITKSGIVSAIEFEKWDRCKDFNPWPDSWCGGVSGSGIVYVDNEKMREFLQQFKLPNGYIDTEKLKKATDWGASFIPYTKIKWTVTYMDATKHFWAKTMPILLKLGAEYGYENVRMVMDFDS